MVLLRPCVLCVPQSPHQPIIIVLLLLHVIWLVELTMPFEVQLLDVVSAERYLFLLSFSSFDIRTSPLVPYVPFIDSSSIISHSN